MEPLTQAEENYLKTIFKLVENEKKSAGTNAIAAMMKTSAASVTDMLRKLTAKGLLHYEKHRGVDLTGRGLELATNLVRKHRLWEVFLLSKLNFSWDEVHDIAEQLEHVQSDELVERLDSYLGRPQFDPHGDPIPDAQGRFAKRKRMPLTALGIGEKALLVGVQESSTAFLQYLDRMQLSIGTQLGLVEHYDYDGSVRILINDKVETTISHKVAENLFVQELK